MELILATLKTLSAEKPVRGSRRLRGSRRPVRGQAAGAEPGQWAREALAKALGNCDATRLERLQARKSRGRQPSAPRKQPEPLAPGLTQSPWRLD